MFLLDLVFWLTVGFVFSREYMLMVPSRYHHLFGFDGKPSLFDPALEPG